MTFGGINEKAVQPCKHSGRRRERRPAAFRWRGWGVLLLVLLVGCDNARDTSANETPQDEQDIEKLVLCHATEEGTFRVLEEEPEAFPDHLLRGDGIPTGPVPGMDGYVFTASCQPEPDSDSGACPLGMAEVDGFCIDRWEASLKDHAPYEVPTSGLAQTASSVVPQGYSSGEVAEVACQAAGKRLCTSQEWLRACRGPQQTKYPYGNRYIPSACNEGRPVHPVVELFGTAADWSPRQMNDARLNQLPNGLGLTGSHPACMSVEGVYDLHGNLHEWVADASGIFRGGFYVDAEINGEGCSYRTTAHGRSYHDYSTGFRCCSDANP